MVLASATYCKYPISSIYFRPMKKVKFKVKLKNLRMKSLNWHEVKFTLNFDEPEFLG